MRYEYKVERISSFLETNLNEKARQGWRCVSVMAATETYLKWTQIAVFERIIDDLDESVNGDITVHEENTKDITAKDADNISADESAIENTADIQSVVLDCNKGEHNDQIFGFITLFLFMLFLLILQMLFNIK